MNVHIHLPAVQLGSVEAEGVSVVPANPELGRAMEAVCEQKRKEFSVEALAESDAIRAVRAMFRDWEVDPSKYRPSSEALLRRVVQGKGLYRVSNVVDIGNLGSVETGWPYGCYDRATIRGPVALRHGKPDEKYEGIGKRVWHLEQRPVLADEEGPFGSPISDSTRTMVTEQAREILVAVYAPAAAPSTVVEKAIVRLGERLVEFAGASRISTRICGNTRNRGFTVPKRPVILGVLQ